MIGALKEKVARLARSVGVPVESLCIVPGKTGPGEQSIELCIHRTINTSGQEAVHLCAKHANRTCPLGYVRVSTLDAIGEKAWPRGSQTTSNDYKPR